MSLPPKKMRELVFQLLYTLSFEQAALSLAEKNSCEKALASSTSDSIEETLPARQEELLLSSCEPSEKTEEIQESDQRDPNHLHSEKNRSSRKGREGLLISMMMREHQVARRHVIEAYHRSSKILLHFSELDPLLSLQLSDHPWSQLFLAEKTVLRLAAYELFYEEKLPLRIVMSEAARIAKKFITPDAANLVHAALGNLIALLPEGAINNRSLENPTGVEEPIQHAL